ncbi:MAG: hypothetical protein JWN52_2518 [Actinomycetia bacterium]|nr:hypothetical protein [Actinomycetes bacterium]
MERIRLASIRRSAVLGTAVMVVMATGAVPASAATTTIRTGSVTADPYSGNVQASLLDTATITTSIGSGTCNQSTMTGSIDSDGTGFDVIGAGFNRDGGDCTGFTSTTVTAQGLPWNGGSVAFDSGHTGNRDATVTIAQFNIKSVANLFGGITCVFGGSITANGYNPDNPSRPDTANDQAQIDVNGAPLNRQPGSNVLCPATATITANYQLLGETTAGSGTFDQPLYIAD